MCVCVSAVCKYCKKYGLASTCLQTTVPYRSVLESTTYRTHVPYEYENIEFEIIKLKRFNTTLSNPTRSNTLKH